MKYLKWHRPSTARDYFQCSLAVCNLFIFTFTVFGRGFSIKIPIREEAKRFYRAKLEEK